MKRQNFIRNAQISPLFQIHYSLYCCQPTLITGSENYMARTEIVRTEYSY